MLIIMNNVVVIDAGNVIDGEVQDVSVNRGAACRSESGLDRWTPGAPSCP